MEGSIYGLMDHGWLKGQMEEWMEGWGLMKNLENLKNLSCNIYYNLYKDTLSITHPSSTAILIHCIDLHTCSNCLSYLFQTNG